MAVVVLPAAVVKRAAKSAVRAHRSPESMKQYGEGRDRRLLAELLELVKLAELRPEPRMVGVSLEEMRLLEHHWLD